MRNIKHVTLYPCHASVEPVNDSSYAIKGTCFSTLLVLYVQPRTTSVDPDNESSLVCIEATYHYCTPLNNLLPRATSVDPDNESSLVRIGAAHFAALRKALSTLPSSFCP